jgi:carboxymethylenebutenolidase
MKSFLSDPSFIAAHLTPLPFKFQSSEGHSVDFPEANGGTAHGYFVGPRAGVRTAIVMVHEWWGLNDYIKKTAVDLHDKTGYGVLAVDLYGGQVASDPQEAGKLMGSVDSTAATAVVKGAVDDLADGHFHTRFSHIGAIGWCFGGGWSLQAAIQGGPKVQACVMYYGMPDDDQSHLAMLHAPVLLVEALEDKWISPEVVAKFKASMAEAHRSLTVRTYEADHAFANPSNPKYHRADAADAMAATLRFFKKYL